MSEELTLGLLLSKGLSPWNILSGNILGGVASTLGYGVATAGCITSNDVGSTLGSHGDFWVVDSTVVDGGTFTIGSCTKNGKWTGGSVSGGGTVQRFRVSANFIKVLCVVYPSSKLVVVDGGGLVSS